MNLAMAARASAGVSRGRPGAASDWGWWRRTWKRTRNLIPSSPWSFPVRFAFRNHRPLGAVGGSEARRTSGEGQRSVRPGTFTSPGHAPWVFRQWLRTSSCTWSHSPCPAGMCPQMMLLKGDFWLSLKYRGKWGRSLSAGRKETSALSSGRGKKEDPGNCRPVSQELTVPGKVMDGWKWPAWTYRGSHPRPTQGTRPGSWWMWGRPAGKQLCGTDLAAGLTVGQKRALVAEEATSWRAGWGQLVFFLPSAQPWWHRLGALGPAGLLGPRKAWGNCIRSSKESLAWCSPEQPARVSPAFSTGLNWTASRGPSQPQPLCDSLLEKKGIIIIILKSFKSLHCISED